MGAAQNVRTRPERSSKGSFPRYNSIDPRGLEKCDIENGYLLVYRRW